jgi:hypothetical protein
MGTGPAEVAATFVADTEAEFEIDGQFAAEVSAAMCTEIVPAGGIVSGPHWRVWTPPLVVIPHVGSGFAAIAHVKPDGNVSVKVNPSALVDALFSAKIV